MSSKSAASGSKPARLRDVGAAGRVVGDALEADGRLVPARVGAGGAHEVDRAVVEHRLRAVARIVLGVDVPRLAGPLELVGEAATVEVEDAVTVDAQRTAREEGHVVGLGRVRHGRVAGRQAVVGDEAVDVRRVPVALDGTQLVVLHDHHVDMVEGGHGARADGWRGAARRLEREPWRGSGARDPRRPPTTPRNPAVPPPRGSQRSAGRVCRS